MMMKMLKLGCRCRNKIKMLVKIRLEIKRSFKVGEGYEQIAPAENPRTAKRTPPTAGAAVVHLVISERQILNYTWVFVLLE